MFATIVCASQRSAGPGNVLRGALRAAFLLAFCTPAYFAQAPARSAAVLSAEALQVSGNFPEAIAAYREVLQSDPRNETAELGLAAVYRRVHNIVEARAVLQKARKQNPQSAAVLTAAGDLEIEAQSYDAAILALRSAIALAPGDSRPRILLASAYLSKSERLTALAQLNQVLAKAPDNTVARLLRAQVYAEQNENEKALADAEKVFAAQPENLQGRILLAKILVRLKLCEPAANLLRPAETPPQLETQGLFLLGNAYECSGQAELAKKTRDDFAAASQADRKRAEDDVQSQHGVEQANELAVIGHFAEALRLLKGALEHNPHNAFAYSQQAKIYFSMHDPEQARQAIAKALAIQPYQPDFLYVLGTIEENAGNLDVALHEFESLIQVNPQEADAYYEIGQIWLKRGDKHKALAAFRTAVAMAPDDADYNKALTDAGGNSQ
jgi:tetratricopeptide (TPR) repeat protein